MAQCSHNSPACRGDLCMGGTNKGNMGSIDREELHFPGFLEMLGLPHSESTAYRGYISEI